MMVSSTLLVSAEINDVRRSMTMLDADGGSALMVVVDVGC
jgi:hypothetical protein